jgi:cytochrome c
MGFTISALRGPFSGVEPLGSPALSQSPASRRVYTELPQVKLTLALAAAFATATLAGPVFAGPAEDLMAKSKCTKCHTATTTKKGPSYADVAAKYKGKPDPTAAMVDMLKTGGKDDHEVVKGASDADLKAVIAIVLAAK